MHALWLVAATLIADRSHIPVSMPHAKPKSAPLFSCMYIKHIHTTTSMHTLASSCTIVLYICVIHVHMFRGTYIYMYTHTFFYTYIELILLYLYNYLEHICMLTCVYLQLYCTYIHVYIYIYRYTIYVPILVICFLHTWELVLALGSVGQGVRCV